MITIASGATALDPLIFVLASVAARGLRFFLVAALIWQFGPPIQQFIERRLGVVTLVFFVLLLAGFVVLKFVI